jgi:LacI family sucrose operon transcriptional repressor
VDKKITIQDIANMVNVSKSSVSRYLNNGYLSKDKAAKIEEAIQKTGFQTNFFAKSLKSKKSKLIGVVLPRIDSVAVGKLLLGINNILELGGYQCVILLSNLDTKKEVANIRKLYLQGVDGIIVDSIAITKAHIELINSIKIPTIFTGQKNEFVSYIKFNDKKAGRIMGKYISQKGHKNVVFLGVNEKDKAVGVERKQGFYEAFIENNSNAQINFVETEFSFRSAYSKGDNVLQFNPTAVVCATDNIGLGILRYLHELKIKVPEQISVTGFGGYAVSAISYPALTTITFDFELAGMKTAQGLLDLIDGKTVEAQDDLPLFFTERESVGQIQ